MQFRVAGSHLHFLHPERCMCEVAGLAGSWEDGWSRLPWAGHWTCSQRRATVATSASAGATESSRVRRNLQRRPSGTPTRLDEPPVFTFYLSLKVIRYNCWLNCSNSLFAPRWKSFQATRNTIWAAGSSRVFLRPTMRRRWDETGQGETGSAPNSTLWDTIVISISFILHQNNSRWQSAIA